MTNDEVTLPRPPVFDPPTVAILWVRERRAGELTTAWRTMTVITWITVVLALSAVWNSSWKLGLSTWWLGPEASPRSPLIIVLPFLAPVAMVAMGFRQMRWVPYFGMGSSAATALIAWGDVGRVNGFAAVEFAVSAGALLVSIASLTGMYRRVEPSATSD